MSEEKYSASVSNAMEIVPILKQQADQKKNREKT
jgi:hypothetical protein